MSRILLVRHARAGDRGEWTGDDSLRPLDAKGWRQAEALIDELARFPIRRLVSSPHLRCVQTFEPLARARGLDIEERTELGEGAGPDVTQALVRELANDDAALCTHGDVLELLLGEPLKKGETAVARFGLRVVERIRIPK